MKLEVVNVTVKAGDQTLVDGLSMTLSQGELVGLLGPNGAGKSTVLRAVVGARPTSNGDILIDGAPIDRLRNIDRARALAYLPQERHVEWRLSARAVVMLGRFPYRRSFGPPSEECEEAVDRALDAVGASDFAHRAVTTLSGGERARILLARALAVETPLLLADEPIADLDPYHQIHVMEILKNRARGGAGILAVLHDLTLAARFMDRLILVDEGRVIEDGAPNDVLSKRNLEDVYRLSALEQADSENSFVLPWQRTDRLSEQRHP